MSQDSVQLDHMRRRITVGGRSTELQEKSWQVLSLLLERAPELVSRAAIIDQVWQGNYLTGDKGLNQAMWAIRGALHDDARQPRFIRTVPRLGYQWIHSTFTRKQVPTVTDLQGLLTKAAGLVAVVILAAFGANLDGNDPGSQIEVRAAVPERTATRAYRVGRDVHVRFAGGEVGILKNSTQANISKPVLSTDGAELAVAILEEHRCRLVTVNVSSGERQDFGACPSEII